MKKKYLLVSVACMFMAWQSSRAQVVDDVVSVGPQYINQVYYSLTNDEQANNPLSDWDLAFELSFYGMGIRANTVTGMEVVKYPGTLDDWDVVDTSGFSTWNRLHDNPLVWQEGALNDGMEDFNLGWGVYNTTTHVVTGNTIFIVKWPSGVVKKLRIDSHASGTYYFTYADLDSENEVSGSIAKANYSGKNFVYYSMLNNETLDFEPASSSWDLVFGKYMDLAPTIYGVTGIRQNIGVEIAQIDGIDVQESTLEDADVAGYSDDINVIGHDWKAINMATFQWDIVINRSYIIKSKDQKYYKLVLTGFGGSSNGNFIFTKEDLGNVVSVNSLVNPSSFFLYPNPAAAHQGSVQLAIDTQSPQSVTIDIINLQGQVVHSSRHMTSGSLQTLNLDIADLSRGLYQVSVQSSTNRSVSKLVIH